MKQIIKSIIRTSIKTLPLKRQIYAGLKPFHLPRKVWQHLTFEGKFRVYVDARRFFYMNHHELPDETVLYWTGINGKDQQTLKLWMKLCEGSETIFDIGANLGIYSLAAKTVSPTAKIFGFEPVSHIYEKFRQNCRVNNFDVTCEHMALSNESGFGNIYIPPGSYGFATASLTESYLQIDGTTSETIEKQTLEAYIHREKIANIDLIKLDVEGFETEVLEGMGDYLKKMRPHIIIEINKPELCKQVELLVKDCDYLYINIDEFRGAVRQKELSLDGKGKGSRSRNFLLCRRESADGLNL